ncbi:MAG: RluA family pseudouridine synthase [Desulfuromonadaceae bacterium]|nr:RluA family pseudouridine synthase [Desulfuromonadaceae bacterium]
MSEIIKLDWQPGQPQERLDRFLACALPDLSRSQLKRLIDDGDVLVNGQPAKAGLRLRGGEQIEVRIPSPQAVEAKPEDLPLEILYEDAYLAVLNKAAGMVVHPACGHRDGTLVNALLHHCDDLSGVGGGLRPGIVHRLDKDTSGVLVVTKDDATHQHLAQQFKVHSIRRCYLTLVHGLVQNAEGTIDAAIGRHPTERKKMSSRSRAGRRAVTHWRVLSRYDRDRLTLLEMTLETGRTHQIRVHLSEMNLPVVGDPLYGNPGRANAIADSQIRSLVTCLHRQALHARLLGFIHPHTGEYMEFSSPLPEDMAELVAALNRKYEVEESGHH